MSPQNHQQLSQDQSRQKFIDLMTNLLQHIQSDSSHQQTIFQCLNSQDISQLFDSINDYDKALRITSIKFIARLLFNSRNIVESLMIRQSNQLLSNSLHSQQKVLITGLKMYNPKKLKEYVIAMSRIQYKKNCLFWCIDAHDCTVSYVMLGEEDMMSVDPKYNLIGIFIGKEERNSQSHKQLRKGPNKSMGIQNKTGNEDLKSPQMRKLERTFTTKSQYSGRFSIGSTKTSSGYSNKYIRNIRRE